MRSNRGSLTTQNHGLTIWQRPSSGSRHGECLCGWKGPRRMSREKIEEDWLLAHPGQPKVLYRAKDVKP